MDITNRAITMGLMVGSIVLISAWDIYVAVKKEYEATVSEIARDTSEVHAILPFFTGMACGHFFWPRKTTPWGMRGFELFSKVAFPISLGVFTFDKIVDHRIPSIVFLMVGIYSGHRFWTLASDEIENVK